MSHEDIKARLHPSKRDAKVVRLPTPDTNGNGGPLDEPGTRDLSSYTVRPVVWLDEPIWQSSCFTLLAGKKGVCKGTLMAGLAARCTRGKLYDRPRQVLVVTSEDSIELDFLPRFLAAGGDSSPGMVQIVTREFLIPRDHNWLEQTAKAMGDVGLIIIDPIGNHVGTINSDGETAVRPAIAPFNDMADRLGALIVGIRHLTKDVSRGALASVLGSTAWVDVPRAVIIMAPDDEDEAVFHYQVIAGNRGPRSSSARRVRLEIVSVPPAENITLLIEEGTSGKDVEDLLAARRDREPSKSDAARELLLDILDIEGPQESDSLDARVATETGLAAKTIRNIRSDLVKAGLIRSFSERDPLGKAEKWHVQRTHVPRPDSSR